MARAKKDKNRNPIFDQILKDNNTFSMFVEAWGIDVFFNQFTLADSDWIEKHSVFNGETVAYTIIRKLMNGEGEKLFTVADKQILMRNFSSEELSNIVMDMRKTMKSDEVDYAGNSKTTS